MTVLWIRAFALTYEVDCSGMSVVAVATFTSSQSASLPGVTFLIGDPGENAGVSPIFSVVLSDTQTFDAIIKVNSTGMIPQMT